MQRSGLESKSEILISKLFVHFLPINKSSIDLLLIFFDPTLLEHTLIHASILPEHLLLLDVYNTSQRPIYFAPVKVTLLVSNSNLRTLLGSVSYQPACAAPSQHQNTILLVTNLCHLSCHSCSYIQLATINFKFNSLSLI